MFCVTSIMAAPKRRKSSVIVGITLAKSLLRAQQLLPLMA